MFRQLATTRAPGSLQGRVYNTLSARVSAFRRYDRMNSCGVRTVNALGS